LFIPLALEYGIWKVKRIWSKS